MPSQPASRALPRLSGTPLGPVLVMLALVMPLGLLLLWGRVAGLTGDLLGSGPGAALADSDMMNYWLGGVHALSGDLRTLFDADLYAAELTRRLGPDYPPHNWSYPPHTLLLVAPLGLVGYEAAFAGSLLATLALYGAAVRLAARRLGGVDTRGGPLAVLLALLPLVLVNLTAAQNGFLTGALLLLALALERDRPWLAGLCLGLLTVKPQLGLLIPLHLALTGNWRCFGAATVSTLGLVALSVLAFGLQPWVDFVTLVLVEQGGVMSRWSGIMLLMMPTPVMTLRLLGVGAEQAFAAQLVWSLALAPLVVWRLAREPDPLRRALVLLAGTAVLVPYLFTYDLAALAACGAILAARETGHPDGRTALWLGLLAAALPLLSFVLAALGLPLGPLLLLLLLAPASLPSARPAARSPRPQPL